MKRITALLLTLALLAACTARKPAYIVQVSLGGWNSPDYSALALEMDKPTL